MSDVNEAKVDKGRSDYGKASIRNYRRKGPGHGEPAFFDPENKRGKAIDQRRKEHKERRGVKGAKVPAYKVASEGMIASVKKGVKRHKDAVQKKKEREGKAVNYAMLAQEYVPEEGYDHMRDKALERGTWKEPERKNPPRKPQTDADKKKSAENSKKALQTVKNSILKKYGAGAIWEPKTQKEGIEDIIARLEKKRISKGGNPDESPLGKKTGRAMKDQQDKARKKIDERTLSSYIPSDRQGEASAANREYAKSQLKKKEDESTKNRGDLKKRDAGKMAKQRLHNKKIMSMGEELVDEKISASGYARAKKWREDQAREKDKKEQEYFAAKARTHKWDGEKWNKREKVSEAKVDKVKHGDHNLTDNPGKEKDRNERKFGNQRFNQKGQTQLRRGLHWSKRGDKKRRGAKEVEEGQSYGLYKGDGKPKGAMAAFAKKKDRTDRGDQKEYERAQAYIKKNPNFGKKKTWREFLEEGNRTSRQLAKSKTQQTGNISADRGDDEKKNRSSRKGLEKDLKKKGIGYSKGVGEYAYKSDGGKEGTKKEVSYQTSPGKGMSKRRFGKVMRRLGRKHGQESVITKDKDKPARLHDTQNKKPDKSFALGKSKPGKNPSKQGETSGTKVRSGKLPSKTKGAMHYGN